jgi:RNA polymerase sigma factor (sigma-70 family)
VLDERGKSLVEEYASVARSIAWEYWRRAPKADVEELQAIALAALVQAADRFPEYQREHGYPLDDHRYLIAFLTRRMRGAILDYARAQDHVTRSQRQLLKSVEAHRLAGASTPELAAAAGVTEREVTEAVAAGAAKPAYLEDALAMEPGGLNVPDPAADVESIVAVRAVLGAVARAVRGLPLEQQVIIVRCYVFGDDLQDIAAALGVTRDRAGQLHESAVLAIHTDMLSEAEAADGCACGCLNGTCGCSAR